MKELVLLGNTCFSSEFRKNNLFLFNICISMKSNMELFYIDVLFQVFEVGEHSLKHSATLSVPLFNLEPPFSPQLATPGSEQTLIFWHLRDCLIVSDAILLYAGAAGAVQTVLLGINLLQLFPHLLLFLLRRNIGGNLSGGPGRGELAI